MNYVTKPRLPGCREGFSPLHLDLATYANVIRDAKIPLQD